MNNFTYQDNKIPKTSLRKLSQEKDKFYHPFAFIPAHHLPDSASLYQ